MGTASPEKKRNNNAGPGPRSGDPALPAYGLQAEMRITRSLFAFCPALRQHDAMVSPIGGRFSCSGTASLWALCGKIKGLFVRIAKT